MRKLFIAGNWKMYTSAATAPQLAGAIVHGVAMERRVNVAVCPPFPYLSTVAAVIKDSPIVLGGQNLYPEKEGAFTGEVSPAMLLDLGCRFVILGHSERRHILGESDAFINRKVHAALAIGLEPIVCVGEKREEREANRTEQVLEAQLTESLAGLKPENLVRLVIAYEPVWAIGTGLNATPEQAQAAHAFIRAHIGLHFGDKAASALIIQYGGSVKPVNAASLLGQPDVDGALVGGASLNADQFLAIIRAGLSLNK